MKFFILLFVFVMNVVVFAEKVEVSATIVKADNLKKKVYFSGNVKIKKSEDMIFANEVKVYFNDQNETEKYEAKGAVKFQFKNKKYFYKGQANNVVYYPLKSLYILTGKAKIEDKITKRNLEGEHIKLNMITGKVTIKGTKRKPVKFIFDIGGK